MRTKVLLIEDEQPMSLILQAYLTFEPKDQFDITTAPTLKRGLALAGEAKKKGEPFDITLLDLGLSDSKGIDTLVQFVKEFPELPVIVLTGSLEENIAMKSAEAGADGFEAKQSITIPQLINEIDFAIEKKRRLNLLRSTQEQVREAANNLMQTTEMIRDATK